MITPPIKFSAGALATLDPQQVVIVSNGKFLLRCLIGPGHKSSK